jgi:pimeloyl-ACP methyl ester carboxylesterase
MLARGATPGRAVVAGTGLDGVVDAAERGRGDRFRRILTHPGTFERGSPEWKVERFVNAVGGDPVALLHVLDTVVDTPREALAAVATPTLVLTGRDDDVGGSGPELAAALPCAWYVEVPGDHMSAVAEPRLGEAVADFLDAPLGEGP